MKRLFAIALLAFALAPVGRASTPTFSSFDLNDFKILTDPIQPWTIQANRTGVTNIFQQMFIAFTNSTIITSGGTNIYNITTNIIENSLVINTNVSIVNNYVTNVTENSFVVNTNVLIENNFTTNITDNSTVIYTNSTVIFTNSTITINGTNVATFGDLVFTNSAGFIYSVLPHTTMSVTNLTSDQTLTASGAFVTTQQTAAILNPGINAVDTFQKALIYIIGTSTNDIVQLSTGNGVGAHLWLLNASTNSTFTLTSGPLSDNPSLNVYVRGGIWQPTELGESLELLGVGGGWNEINRANPNGPAPALGVNYWTNAFGFLTPITAYQPVEVDSLLIDRRFSISPLAFGLNAGTNLIDVSAVSEMWGVSTLTNGVTLALTDGFENDQQLTIFSFTNFPGLDGTFTLYANSTLPGGGIVKLFADTDWIGGNGRGISLRWIQPNWVEVGRWNTITGTVGVGANYWTNIAGILQPIDLTLPVMVTNQIIFGPGTNHVLQGIGDEIRYTSPDALGNSILEFSNPNVVWTTAVGNSVAGGELITSGSQMVIGQSAQNLTLTAFEFRPSNPNVIALGDFGANYRELWLGGALYNEGFWDFTGTNYSRLAISHTGTNGAVVFDSQASGIAGDPRPFNFNYGGTNIATLSAASGSTALTLYDSLVGTTSIELGFTFSQVPELSTSDNFLFINPSLAFARNCIPQSGSDVSLGLHATSSEQFNEITGTNLYSVGYFTGTAWNQLHIYHDQGTNGAINFFSESWTNTIPNKFNFGFSGDSLNKTNLVQIDWSTTSGDTPLLLLDVSTGTIKRVSVGANDSGGAGFKLLRVSN